MRHTSGGASTISNSLLDGDLFPWLVNPGNPTMSPLLARERHRHVSLIQSMENKGSGGQTLNI